MRSIFEVSAYNDIITRINLLEPDSTRSWGKMTPNQMICHISDPIRDIMGVRTTEPLLPAEVVQHLKAIVFGEMDWDHDLQTFPPYSQGDGGEGTKPTNLKDDRSTLLELLDQLFNTPADYRFHPHAGLNILTRDEFGIYIWRHTDYHLRQFGV
jgi:hypothetical protein